MHIYFSGINGAALTPLALIAKQAGHTVSGSDKQRSDYTDYLGKHGVTDVHIGQTAQAIADIHERQPIDWLVFSSAVLIEQPNHPELAFCREHNIKTTKRDALLNFLIGEHDLRMIAVAGTHGKTTTTAMVIWVFNQLGIPLSYSVGAKLSFGEMGSFQPGSQFFAYECDEYDRNFLAFSPAVSLIAGIDWDHADIYPTRDDYNQAFADFIQQSDQTVIWDEDAQRLGKKLGGNVTVLDSQDQAISMSGLPGKVNRLDAYLVAFGLAAVTNTTVDDLLHILARFPGVSRRFEKLAENLYTDYAHTPRKIEGALQIAHEAADQNVVVVYEGLHNTRQHFIKKELATLFTGVKHLYVVPSYLAREDASLPMLSPADIIQLTGISAKATPSQLDETLWQAIKQHQAAGDLVLCLTAGGGNSLDAWLRQHIESTS